MAEQRREIGLAWRGGQQIVAAHHLVDTLFGVVDDDREVVGGNAVAPPDHEIVDRAGVFAVQQVTNRCR